ncbi:MAG: nickel-responsive transcriptional regulator NikR [Armatimonadota bacterium]
MDNVERFGVSMPKELVKAFDEKLKKKGYTNRSEAIRDLARAMIVEDSWDDNEAIVLGVVTLVYDHHTTDLGTNLAGLQHNHHDIVLCSQHVHIDHHNCLETIILKGKASHVQAMADRLIGTKGVKHGNLTKTTPGDSLH